MTKFPLPQISSKRVFVIAGAYGSGKSEVAVNLARLLAETRPVALIDLDIVNPYFRSREAADALEKIGVTPISPRGVQEYADLPIVLPEVWGAIQEFQGTVIVDVGGDDVGARVLSSLGRDYQWNDYELYMVLNANRPFTDTLSGATNMMDKIAVSTRLSFSGIISNTHLVEHTTHEDVTRGVKLALEVSVEEKIPVVCITVERRLVNQLPPGLEFPVLPLDRGLLKPWERPD